MELLAPCFTEVAGVEERTLLFAIDASMRLPSTGLFGGRHLNIGLTSREGSPGGVVMGCVLSTPFSYLQTGGGTTMLRRTSHRHGLVLGMCGVLWFCGFLCCPQAREHC